MQTPLFWWLDYGRVPVVQDCSLTPLVLELRLVVTALFDFSREKIVWRPAKLLRRDHTLLNRLEDFRSGVSKAVAECELTRQTTVQYYITWQKVDSLVLESPTSPCTRWSGKGGDKPYPTTPGNHTPTAPRSKKFANKKGVSNSATFPVAMGRLGNIPKEGNPFD